jgi:sugar lactone lactonase YvrE
MDFWEARPTGRLLRYDPASGETTVALDSLDFANGVAVGPDGAYVLVNETMTARIHRLWLAGPKAGVREIFIEGLPGVPDNIAYDGRGIFWVGLFAPRTKEAERVRTMSPFLRKVIYRIPERFRGSPVTHYGMVIGIDTTGTVRYNLQDPTGRFHSTTGALRVGDTLFVSTLSRNVLAKVPMPSSQ